VEKASQRRRECQAGCSHLRILWETVHFLQPEFKILFQGLLLCVKAKSVSNSIPAA